ncbi:hypothetical protein BKA70DRAFT_1233751 [Coprinopsis sp. MPI-PUGE-AT-0042]|nr:hypothetical protein BKA70DRAFT_1233751 [Coprinopsis sp. MPI-PUGE-AT-0042]
MSVHHIVGSNQNAPLDLQATFSYQSEVPDPALLRFIPKLKIHLFSVLQQKIAHIVPQFCQGVAYNPSPRWVKGALWKSYYVNRASRGNPECEELSGTGKEHQEEVGLDENEDEGGEGREDEGSGEEEEEADDGDEDEEEHEGGDEDEDSEDEDEDEDSEDEDEDEDEDEGEGEEDEWNRHNDEEILAYDDMYEDCDTFRRYKSKTGKSLVLGVHRRCKTNLKEKQPSSFKALRRVERVCSVPSSSALPLLNDDMQNHLPFVAALLHIDAQRREGGLITKKVGRMGIENDKLIGWARFPSYSLKARALLTMGICRSQPFYPWQPEGELRSTPSAFPLHLVRALLSIVSSWIVQVTQTEAEDSNVIPSLKSPVLYTPTSSKQLGLKAAMLGWSKVSKHGTGE